MSEQPQKCLNCGGDKTYKMRISVKDRFKIAPWTKNPIKWFLSYQKTAFAAYCCQDCGYLMWFANVAEAEED